MNCVTGRLSTGGRMSFRRRLKALLARAAVVACVVAITGSALAATDEEIFRGLTFDLANTGARATSLGGAFVAIADDPTAVRSNPAGLGDVSEPEFFVSIVGADNDPIESRSRFGSLEVAPVTGARNLPYLSLTGVSDRSESTAPGFLGVVWPFEFGPTRRRVTVAFSRETVFSEDAALRSSDASTGLRVAFDTFPNVVAGGRVEAYSVAGTVDGRISTDAVRWSASAALDVHPDFTFGAGLGYATLDLEASTTTHLEDPLELVVDPSHPRLPSQPTTALFGSRIDDSDTGFSWVAGILWHPDSLFAGGRSPWRFGVAFRKGARFTVREQTFINETPDRALDTRIVEPDRYSVGASFRPTERWTIGLEAERIEYSDLLEDFEAGVNVLTGPGVGGFFPVDPDGSVRFDADDAFVPRVGAAYAFTAGTRVRGFVAAGLYRAPDGRVYLAEFNAADPAVNAAYLDAFRAGDDENHVTLGAGVSFARYDVHAGVDTWDGGLRLSVSVGARLGRFR